MRQHQSRIRQSFALLISILTLCSLSGAAVWARITPESSTASVSVDELSRHVKYLASSELQGRGSGTPGGDLAAEYIAAQFKQYGLKSSAEGNYFQPFDFTAGIKYGETNSLSAAVHEAGQKKTQQIDFRSSEDFQPLNFSSSGQSVAATGKGKKGGELVLAGFGISAPQINYDDYAKIDVKDKIVLVLPFSPEGNNPHGKFAEYMPLRRKALAARERGARAILFISEADNLSEKRGRTDDGNYTDAGIIAFAVSKRMANELLKSAGKTVEDLQKGGSETGTGETLALESVQLKLKADLTREVKTTRNVIGWLEGNDEKLKNEYLVIGAHYDHLGMGGHGSLSSDGGGIHYGADDNASGTAGLMELARIFSANRQHLRRSIVFAAFSGEELGLLGSNYYVKNPIFPLERTIGMLNMDMIGRMKNDTLVIGGIGTSPQWKPIVEELNRTRGFTLKLQEDGYGPSDHASFYGKDMPVLFFFTGVHDDYHKPSDTADRLNLVSEGAIVSLVYDIAAQVVSKEERLAFTKATGGGERRAMNNSFRVYVGSVPDYAEQIEGVKLSGVRPGSPAEKAGIKAGDIIVQLAGKAVKNVYDYTYTLQDMKPDETVSVIVLRDGQKVELKLTPIARQ
jgi:aminopeptidase YwaD